MHETEGEEWAGPSISLDPYHAPDPLTVTPYAHYAGFGFSSEIGYALMQLPTAAASGSSIAASAMLPRLAPPLD